MYCFFVYVINQLAGCFVFQFFNWFNESNSYLILEMGETPGLPSSTFDYFKKTRNACSYLSSINFL